MTHHRTPRRTHTTWQYLLTNIYPPRKRSAIDTTLFYRYCILDTNISNKILPRALIEISQQCATLQKVTLKPPRHHMNLMAIHIATPKWRLELQGKVWVYAEDGEGWSAPVDRDRCPELGGRCCAVSTKFCIFESELSVFAVCRC